MPKFINNGVLGGLVAVIIGAIFVTAVIGANNYLEAATIDNHEKYYAPAADHSNCQYPERWTNPVNGCDNSDPAVPECIRAANTQESEAACIAAFVQQHEAAAQPVPTTTATPAPSTNTCGGK